jgi:hypothetical protein
LYLAYLGRPADPAGLAFWSAQLEHSGGNFNAVLDAFVGSPESLWRFGSTTSTERVTQIYQELFDRQPESAGLAFWTKAIDSGACSLAEAAIAITQGAQGTDRDLNTLRNSVADAFTAQVASTGSAYDGNDAVEAGRLLVQSVSLDTPKADQDAMVEAAAKLAHVASHTPLVVTALAGDGDLVGLLATARGGADPVGLLQTLAGSATIAAGNPDTLDSLLRGGGMLKVLTVMPASATLEDVVDALDHGGLPAAVEVVYPSPPAQPAPPTPPAVVLPQFVSISFGPNDGNLAIGEPVTIKLVFSKAVVVDATAALLLNNHGSAAYSGGSGTDTLIFTYMPQAGETVADLATAATGALASAIRDAAGNVVSAGSFDGVDPAGTLAIDGEPTTVGAADSSCGVTVTSNKAGEIYLVDAAHDTQTRVYTTDGGDAVAGTFTLGEQAVPAVGAVQVKAASGALGNDDNGTVVALGSSLGDTLGGQHVWGFGGNDTLAGTTGDDHLFGGAGNDSITGGLGADVAEGGAGADTIVIAVNNVTGGGFSSDSGYNDAQSGANLANNAGGGNDHGDDTIEGFEFGIDTVKVVATNVAQFNHNTGAVLGAAQAGSWPGNVGAFAANVGLLDLDSNGGFGEFAVNFSNPSATLTQANWQAALQYDIGGTTGADTITTGARADIIRGGAGADTIHAGAGADLVIGGEGADAIDLGSDNTVDTVVYGPGETGASIFADGASTSAMDVVSGAGAGDVISVGAAFSAAPAGHGTYLADATANNYAVVRGSDAGGVFAAGTSGSDNDYLVQWADGNSVNSIVMHDFGTAGLGLSVNAQQGTMKLVQPVPSTLQSVGYAMTGNPSLLFLNTTVDAVTGLTDTAGFSLQDMSTGTASATTADYTDEWAFGVPGSGMLRFDATLSMDLYKMSWQDNTFVTNNPSGAGFLAAGSLMFAGGMSGGMLQEGFTVSTVVTVDSEILGIAESDEANVNQAFIDDGHAAVRIMTGGGKDVVSDNGGTLTVAYDAFEASAQDLVLGFDSGNDVIELEGQAAGLVDKNGDQQIEWATATNGKAVVTATTEAVEITAYGLMSTGTSPYEVTQTLDTLNSGIDLSGMTPGDHLLILATNGTTAGALYYLQDANSNGQIDAGELTVVDVFSDGVAHAVDVTLVGVLVP